MLALPYYNTTTLAAGHIPVTAAWPTGLPAAWMLVLNQIATVEVTNTLGKNQLAWVITRTLLKPLVTASARCTNIRVSTSSWVHGARLLVSSWKDALNFIAICSDYLLGNHHL